MIDLKTPEEIELIREGGQILSRVLGTLVAEVRPGTDTAELEKRALELMAEAGGEPAFKGYEAHGAKPYPTALCTSINDEVVHAAAEPGRRVGEGDLLKIDVGLKYRGLYTDMAVTVPVGTVSAAARKLARVTREALLKGLEPIRPGAQISDIGLAVDGYVTAHGFTTVKDLVGHGVGRDVHEAPNIPNYFEPNLKPVEIRPGMVLAVEPMVNAGEAGVKLADDGWTYATADGSLSAHFEVTVAVTERGREIMTPLPEISGLADSP